MNVLVVHNRYCEPGGEDRVVALESTLLERHGHTVVPFILDNAAVAGMNRLALAARTVWSRDAYRDVRQVIASERIDLVHVHNTLPLASPAVYYAAAAENVPVVQTLHNYRLLCANALFVRDEQPCVSCVGATIPFAAVRHGCYRGSRAATAAVSTMLVVHRAARTWHEKVDTYIATTAFARGMFVAGGLPADRIVVKPHFVDPDPGAGPGRGGFALYVGRLSREKGVATLLGAWAELGGRVPLKIVGDGPMAQAVAEAAAQVRGVSWLGRRDPSEVRTLMADAAALVFPSIAYETFGQVVIEALAAGTPVIASSAGAGAELVDGGRTGILVRPGDADDLAAQTARLFTAPESLLAMRTAARAAFEARFSAEANYGRLAAIYRDAIARRIAHPQATPVPDPFPPVDEARR